jgi:hypothetical protein
MWRRPHVNRMQLQRIVIHPRACISQVLAIATIGASFALALAACTGMDTSRSDQPAPPSTAGSAPDSPPPGFATLVLEAANPRPISRDIAAPAGSVWYRMVQVEDPSPGSALEWYVRAEHLLAGHVYRVEMTVDKHYTYSVGSARADAEGVLAAHGILPRFADRFCVGAPAPPGPLTAGQHVAVGVKRDGSGAGPVSPIGPLTDPGRTLPCGGNGDGNFDYLLASSHEFTIGRP